LKLLNTAPLNEREKLALALRLQGFTFRYIATKLPKIRSSSDAHVKTDNGVAFKYKGFQAGDVGVRQHTARVIVYKAARKLKNNVEFSSQKINDLIVESFERKI